MSQAISVDCIIDSRWILPVVPRNTILEHCSIVIDKGQILEIVPTENLSNRYHSAQHVQLPQHLLMPGLINAHGHAAMTLLRGYADDLPLKTWLEEHIWPAESKWVDGPFVMLGTQLAIAEMLLGGTTYFSDMYFFPDQAAQAVSQSGIKAQITFPIMDFPTNWARDIDEYFDRGLKLHDEYRNHQSIKIGFGPHAPYTVSDGPLKRISSLSAQIDAPIHIHVHETTFEVEQSIKDHGVRPIERLNKLGILGPQTQCVHMTEINDADLDTIAETGAAVIHCPESNLKLASGLCPVARFIERGVSVALGTDGAASNNDLSMLGEMQTAALIGKVAHQDATAVSATQAIEMATIKGAQALGVDKRCGSLEVGKAADIIALKLDHPSLVPLYDVQSNLVYNNRSMQVSHVWIDGNLCVHEGTLLTLDMDEIISQSTQWQQKTGTEQVD